ncbi:signal peptide peptidase SppA [Macrococcus hajekii]|uniref:Signal peptide peptidase SppA n=2 Tax=Macrococcus hajekii TaxID=198482 RepID=A0A4R6BLL7_9STAP|nr:signal peptide peptidase SppA [Macrococcus hajekii]TDM02690.1 signal peptide peptidase SppA [Macrococcus hajekii]GGB03078.1 putative signal peptide peptidase SppA [Macrococcus hajekii]
MNKRIIALLVAASLLILSVATSLFTTDFTDSFTKELEGQLDTGTLDEKSIEGTDMSNRIARVEVDGVIQDTGSPSVFAQETYNHESMMQQLEQIKEDKSIKGVLMVVNSPGGGVYESAEIYDKINEIKKSGKKVYVTMKNMAASGGYYISAPADKIFASRETLTGSLGVIMQSMNYKELADKYGVKFNTIKSGAHKDIMSPTKEMDAEERKILQSLVDESYDQFVKVISDGRHISQQEVKKLADGRVYSGLQAQKNGLVDEIGLEEDALKALKKDIKSNDAEVIEFAPTDSIFGENPFAAQSFVKKMMGNDDLAAIKELMSKRQGTTPMYLYGE